MPLFVGKEDFCNDRLIIGVDELIPESNMGGDLPQLIAQQRRPLLIDHNLTGRNIPVPHAMPRPLNCQPEALFAGA